MEFIKWGSETPEQRAHRLKLEEQAMLHQAMARKMFEQRAAAQAAPSAATSAAAAGAAGGEIAPTSLLYMPDYYMFNPDEYAY